MDGWYLLKQDVATCDLLDDLAYFNKTWRFVEERVNVKLAVPKKVSYSDTKLDS